MKLKSCMLAMLWPFLSMCQSITIKGNVINEEGNPVSAATITLKGTTISKVANAKGEFTLSNTKLSDSIIVSAIGYQTATEPNNTRGLITVILKRKVTELDETIIMAYGTTTRRFNTGNISKVSAAEIAAQPVSNPLATLYGRIPGLEITQNSGMPGAGFKIQVRGQNSLTQGTDPLFVIDGVPFLNGNSQLNQMANAANAGLSPLNTINPANIESIEILKDADATAIYGSRGANGVILITTKKATAGKLAVTASFKSGFSRVTRTMEMLTTSQYLQMRREAFANDGITPTTANAPDLLLWDTSRYTNFKQLFTGGRATFNETQVSLAAATGGTRFQLALSHNRETSVFNPSQNGNRYTASLAVGHTTPGNKFNVNSTVGYTLYNSNLLRNDLTAYINLPPHFLLYDSLGNINWLMGNTYISSLGLTNPAALLLRKYNGSFHTFNSSLQVSYKLTPSLTARFSNGFQQMHGAEQHLFPGASLNPISVQMANAEFGNSKIQTLLSEPQLEYNRSFHWLRLSVLAGASLQQTENRAGRVIAENYTNDYQLNTPIAAGNIRVRDEFSLYRYAALFARINLRFNETWVLNLSARRDGSSRFGPDRRFAAFGAAGAAWLFSNHAWLKNNLSWLNFGKLRASIGVTGNDQVGDYQYLNTWVNTTVSYQGIAALQPSRLFNPVYAWEKNTKAELGLELGFLNNRIFFNMAAYRNTCGNQLVNYSLPIQTGFTTVLQNFNATIENKGIEITVTSKNIVSHSFNWHTGFNITANRNKLLSFPDLEKTPYRNLFRIGQPLSSVALYRFTGINPSTGIYTFFDADADGQFTITDRVSLRNTATRFFGGLTNTFTFKNIELQLLFEFRKQPGKNYLSTQGTFIPGYFYNNQPAVVLNRWQKPGDMANVQRYVAVTASPGFVAAQSLLANSDAVYTDASFIRLRNISLTWSLPQSAIKKWKLTEMAFFIQAQNLFTLTRYTGADPETQNLYIMPPMRTMVAGIRIQL